MAAFRQIVDFVKPLVLKFPTFPFRQFWFIPTFVGIDYLWGRFVKRDWITSKYWAGNRLSYLGLAFILGAWLYDDASTGVAFQLPFGGEGNPWYADDLKFIMELGLASTETAACRTQFLFQAAQILIFQKLGWLNQISRSYLYFCAFVKLAAGETQNRTIRNATRSPSDYGFLDFFTFKPGKSKPYALQMALHRRRVLEDDSPTWYTLLMLLTPVSS